MVSSQLPKWKQEFLKLCLDESILRFGSFKVKSGRTSPYYFNIGDLNSARLTNVLCTAYAKTIINLTPALEFEVLFGPAYKGCGLSYGVTMKLGELAPGRFADLGFCHDRKEKKDHGEGGSLVGMSLKGKRVLIIDDVIAAGIAKREAVELVMREGGTVVGIVIALNRMEKIRHGAGGSKEDRQGPRVSPVKLLEQEFGIDVHSVITLDDLVNGMLEMGLDEQANVCKEYRAIYGAGD